MYVASKSLAIADCVHYRAVCVIVKMLLFTMDVPDSDFSNPAEAVFILTNLDTAIAGFDTLSILLTTDRFHTIDGCEILRPLSGCLSSVLGTLLVG